MNSRTEKTGKRRVWPFLLGAVAVLVIGVFATRAFSASITVNPAPLQNVGGDVTYSSDWISASSVLARHEASTSTINGSDQITGVTVDGTKATGGSDVTVQLLDSTFTILDTGTASLASASGSYSQLVSMTSGNISYTDVVEVAANYVTTAFAVLVNGSVSTKTTSSSPYSWSHTVGAGSNRLLVVAITESDKGVNPSGVTFGGVAMTAGPAYVANKAAASLWYLKNPAVSTATIAASYSGQTPPDFLGGAINFINVDQTTPVPGATGANNNSVTSGSVNVTSAANDLVVSVVGVFENTPTATGSPTPTTQWALNGPGSKTFGTATTQAGQTTVTSSFTFTRTAYALAAMNINVQ